MSLVLGGGITGLTTALLLARRGARVVVIEANRVAGGVTGNNTAKVTALQSTVYSTLQRAHDQHAAADETELPDVQREAAAVIGRNTPFSPGVYVASGLMKWGLTGGTMAAAILADLISGRPPEPWADRFSPHRISLRSAPRLMKMNAKAGADLVIDRITPAEVSSPDEVPAGEARVVRDGLGKLGAFREGDGTLHMVSLRCTHLGCLLRFNGAERSWDCPCHGSRFDVSMSGCWRGAVMSRGERGGEFGNHAHRIYLCCCPEWRGADMSEPRTPAGGAPSAESVKEHVKQTGEEKNLGAGNQEPDPATAEAPPSDLKAGDKKRDQS